MLPLCKNFRQGFFSSSSCRIAAKSERKKEKTIARIIFEIKPTFTECVPGRCQLQARLTSEVVEPSLLGSVMLNTIEVFFPIVHVVLEGSVTIVTEVSLPHGSGEIQSNKES